MTAGIPEFRAWPKIPRLNRPVVVTEKIDGTNACVVITEASEQLGTQGSCTPVIHAGTRYEVRAQSRSRFITPDDDNFGFAGWVAVHAQELVRDLGPGYHFGEWWGHGIQRGYGCQSGERYFSLFDITKGSPPGDYGLKRVPVLDLLPTLDPPWVENILTSLRLTGSVARPGAEAEGVVVFHRAANQAFKVLIENDDKPKGEAR